MLSDARLALIDLVRARVHRGSPVARSTVQELSQRQGRPLRVGVVRFDGIGDWILTFPLISALQRSPLVADVTLVGHTSHRSLLRRLQGVEVQAEDVWASHHTPWPHGPAGKVLAISALGQRRAARAGRLSRDRFDLVVVPRWDTDRGQNAIAYAAATGAAIAAHDPSLQPQATRKERADRGAIAVLVEDHRSHAHESGRLERLGQELDLDMTATTAPVRALLGLPSERSPGAVAVLHTGAHDAFRRWPLTHWARAIDLLLETTPWSIVLVGGPADATEHAGLIARDPDRVRSVAGLLPLGELPDLLDAAQVMIGCDSGPAHLAAVLSVPTVVVSAFPEGDDPGHPNSPDRFGARSAGGSQVLRPEPAEAPFAELSADRRAELIGSIPPEVVHRAALGLTGRREVLDER